MSIGVGMPVWYRRRRACLAGRIGASRRARPLQHEPTAPRPLSKNKTRPTVGSTGDVGLVAGVGLAVGPHASRSRPSCACATSRWRGSSSPTRTASRSATTPSRSASSLPVSSSARSSSRGGSKGRRSASPRSIWRIDSLGFELGGFFAQPEGGELRRSAGPPAGARARASDPPARERSVGRLPRRLRWSDAVLGGGDVRDSADRALFLSITLAWHQIFGAHAVDVNDRAPR